MRATYGAPREQTPATAERLRTSPPHQHHRHHATDASRFTSLLLLFDADGDGALDTSELTKALAEMGVAAPAEQCDAILRWFDADGSGQLDLVEFASLVRSLQARHVVDDAAHEYSREISPRRRRDLGDTTADLQPLRCRWIRRDRR